MKLGKRGKRIVAGMLAGMLVISLGLSPASIVRAEEISQEGIEEIIMADDGAGEPGEEATSVPADEILGKEEPESGGIEQEDQEENSEESIVGDEETEYLDEIITKGQDGEPGQELTEPAEEEEELEIANENDVQPDDTEPETDIVSGTDWTLDADGKLTIQSDAGMADWGHVGKENYGKKIISVEIQDGVTSIGESAFFGCGLTSITLPSSVTSIGEYAFGECSDLTSIEIPSSVTSIGARAFRDCSRLACITLPSGLTSIESYLFSGCSSLINITLPSGVTSIGVGAFRACSSLTSMTIPSGVTSIESHLFSGCSSLTSIALPSGVTSIGEDAFSGCSLINIMLPSGMTSIGSDAFSGCRNLTSIDIPTGLTNIGAGAFTNCSSLASIDIPTGVTSIGDSAFFGCSNLTSITLPPGLTSIGGSTFFYCSSLTSITIPFGVISIGSEAFRECENLTSITIPSSVTSIGAGAFYNCWRLKNITLPSGVTSIGAEAFKECSGLTSITLPPGVTSIGDYTFRDCSSLTSITLPPDVISIGDYAFEFCGRLTSIMLPSSVENIGIGAFRFCNSLESVTMWGTTPPMMDIADEYTGRTYVFDCCKFIDDRAMGIKVPSGTAEAYKVAWTEWAAYIVEDSGSEPTDREKVDAAKQVVEVVLTGIQVSNTTTKESLEAAIKVALAEMGVSSDDVAIAVEDFTRTDATINTAGNISGTIKITSGTESTNVPVNKTIDKLPITPAGKVAAAKAAVEEAVKKAVDTALEGIMVTNDNADETAAKMKEVIPEVIAGALEEAGVSADEVLVGEADIEIKLATIDSEGSINVSIPLTSKEDAGETDRVMVQVPITKPSGEADSSKDTETAQKMVEDALKEITATNETTKEDILAALREELGDKAAVEGIEKFEKQDATQETPGSISLSVKVTINGKTVITNVTVPIAQLRRKNGVYIRFTDYFDLDGSTPRYKYTGTAIKPMVEVYNNETLLTPGSDYTIGYKNNTKVGTTAALTVKGKGSFSGTANVVNFAIINADIKQDTVHPTEMTVVINTKMAPIIMSGTKKLTTKDFRLEGAGLVNGKYVAATGEGNPNTLTVKGIGSYAGSSFEIKVRVIEKSAAKKLAVMVDKNFKPVFSGNALNVSDLIRRTQGGEGAITVTDSKDRTKILKEGTDFTILCTSSLSNAGTVTFTVTGMGEYTGSVDKSFKISPLKMGDSSRFSVTFEENKTYEYRPSGTTVDNLVVTYLGETNSKEDDKILTQGVDYKVAYSNHKKVSGTKDATLKVTFLGNYKGSSALSRTFKIAAAKLSAASTKVIVPDQVYTSGNRAYKSTPIVTVDGAAIKASNYTVTYAWATESEAGNEAKYISDNQVKITLAQGDTYAKVKVTITPKQTGSYALAEGAVLTGEYYVRKADNAVNLSKAKVTFYNKAGTQLKALEYNGNVFYTPTGNRPETDYDLNDPNAVYVKVAVGGAVVDPKLYDLIWINATEKGMATVVIRGKGIETGNGIAVGSKNQTINIKAMTLKGKTLKSFMENTANAIESLKSIF